MKKTLFIMGWLICAIIMIGCKEKSTSHTADASDSSEQSLQEFLNISISNPHHEADCVYLTSDADGLPYISWVERDSTGHKYFYCAKFDKSQKQFGQKKAIPLEQNAAIHEEGMPKLAIKGNGDLFALYETSTPVEGSKWGLGDVRYVISTDDGETWTQPQSLDPEDLAEGLSGNFTNMGRLEDGEIGIAWLGTDFSKPDGGRPVKFTKTKADGGIEKSQTIVPNGCECCRTAVASGKNGEIYIAYRDLLENSIRDISLVVSTDEGKNFGEPTSFSADHWQIEGCPHNGPALATFGNQMASTWFSDGVEHQGANFAYIDREGKMLSYANLSKEAQFVQNHFLKDGTPIVAYNENYSHDGKMFSRIVVALWKDKQLFKKEITPSHVDANYPMIAGWSNDQMVVAWKGAQQIHYAIVGKEAVNETEEQSLEDWVAGSQK